MKVWIPLALCFVSLTACRSTAPSLRGQEPHVESPAHTAGSEEQTADRTIGAPGHRAASVPRAQDLQVQADAEYQRLIGSAAEPSPRSPQAARPSEAASREPQTALATEAAHSALQGIPSAAAENQARLHGASPGARIDADGALDGSRIPHAPQTPEGGAPWAQGDDSSSTQDPRIRPEAASARHFDPNAIEAHWLEWSQPGVEHRWLDQLAGTWQANTQVRVLPDSEPAPSQGTLRAQWVLGQRFLQLEYQAAQKGQTLEGFGHLGFDKARDRFVGYWIDSLGTQMADVSTGQLSKDRASLTLRRKAIDPMTGLEREVKEVLSLQSPQEFHWQTWGYAPDGTFFQMARSVYRRTGEEESSSPEPPR